jgi:hypothetical protein
VTVARPAPGAYWSLHHPATFRPCSDHPYAQILTVLVVRQADAQTDAPRCAECGRYVLRWE